MASKKGKGKKKLVREEKDRGSHIEKLEREIHRIRSSMSGTAAKGQGTLHSDGTRNALCWVNSVFHPFSGACHFPETLCEGTDVSSLHRLSVPSAAVTPSGETSVVVTAKVYSPSLKSYTQYITSAVSTGNVSWAASDHPKYSTLDGYVGGYRVTAMGFRVQNTSPLLNRNGRLFIGRLPPKKSGAAVLPDLYTLCEQSTEVKCFDLARLPAGGVECFWIPMTTQGYVSTRTHNSTTNNSFTALGFKSPETDVLDNRIFFFAVSTSAEPFSIFVEEVMNIEFIPHIEDQFLFEPKAVMGSQTAVEESFASVVDKAAKAGVADIIRTGVKDLYEGAKSELKLAWNYLKSPIMRQVEKEGLQLGGTMLLASSRILGPNGDGSHIRRSRGESKNSPPDPTNSTPTSPGPRLPRRRGSVVLTDPGDDWVDNCDEPDSVRSRSQTRSRP